MNEQAQNFASDLERELSALKVTDADNRARLQSLQAAISAHIEAHKLTGAAFFPDGQPRELHLINGARLVVISAKVGKKEYRINVGGLSKEFDTPEALFRSAVAEAARFLYSITPGEQ